MTIEECRAYIARKKNQIEDLERLYGTGVSSAAIGEEIAILSFYIRDAENQLKEMEFKNETKQNHHYQYPANWNSIRPVG
jgi:hypothetical protein